MAAVLVNPFVQIVDATGKEVTLDAFGRQRVSAPDVVFEHKQNYDNGVPLLFDHHAVGAGAVTYVNAKAASELTTGTAAGNRAVRQTKRYFNYQPGKSLLAEMTFNFHGASTNVRKQAGYFDDDNGCFARLDSGLAVVIRSKVSGSVVDDVHLQATWNLDKLDGTGPSGVTLDVTKTQIFFVDFQYLGAGSARFGFNVGGMNVYCHQVDHSNLQADVWMQTPNLPLRWEIENIGVATGAPKLSAYCGTVQVEGGVDLIGTSHSADSGVTPITVGLALKPLISVRLRTSHVRAAISLRSLEVLAAASVNFRWALVLNPVFVTPTGHVWVPVTNSAVEYDVTEDDDVTAGTQIASGYGSDALFFAADQISTLLLAADFAGTADVMTLAAQTLTGNEDMFGKLAWVELL